MGADAQSLGHLDQAVAVNLTLLALDLWGGGAHDQVDDLRTDGHSPGHGLDHIFQSLPAVDESEGANYPPARQPQPGLVGVVAVKIDFRYSMGNHPYGRALHTVYAC